MKKKINYIIFPCIIIIIITWLGWIMISSLKANEFGDAINPIITSITLIVLLISYLSQQEEIRKNERRIEKDEFQKLFFNFIELIKNARGRIQWRGYKGLEGISCAIELIKGVGVIGIRTHVEGTEKVYDGEDAINYEIEGYKKEIFGEDTLNAYFQLITYTYNHIENSIILLNEEKEEYRKLLEVILAKPEIELYKKYIAYIK